MDVADENMSSANKEFERLRLYTDIEIDKVHYEIKTEVNNQIGTDMAETNQEKVVKNGKNAKNDSVGKYKVSFTVESQGDTRRGNLTARGYQITSTKTNRTQNRLATDVSLNSSIANVLNPNETSSTIIRREKLKSQILSVTP